MLLVLLRPGTVSAHHYACPLCCGESSTGLGACQASTLPTELPSAPILGFSLEIIASDSHKNVDLQMPFSEVSLKNCHGRKVHSGSLVWQK